MADKSVFENVFNNFTIKHEGLHIFTNIPGDAGGATYSGVTQAVYDSYRVGKNLEKQSVKLMGDDEMNDIYFNNYWSKAGCDKITDNGLAMSVFDFAVNGGVSRAGRYLGLAKDSVAYNNLRERFYRKIVQNNPTQNKFLKGWLNRVSDLRKFVG